MKKIHRVFAMLMAAIMALSLITTAFAEPTIDTSKKASLNIYKYDIISKSRSNSIADVNLSIRAWATLSAVWMNPTLPKAKLRHGVRRWP